MRSNRLPFGAVATVIALVTAAVVFLALGGVAIAQNTGQTADSSASGTNASATASTPAGSARAQTAGGFDLAINVHASTLGLGGEISKLIGGHIGMRLGGNVLNYNGQQTIQGISYDARFNFKNYTALADLFPVDHGSFHFTGGYVSETDGVNGTAVPAAGGTITLNGTQYTSAQVGVVTGKLTFPRSGAYAGIGWGSPSSRGGRVRLLLDLGAVIGTPTFDMHATNESADPQIAADVTAQREKTREKIDNYGKAWPVMSLGLGVHF